MAPKVEKLHDKLTELGEGPHWDAETQSLYYVDLIQHTINKYVPSTKKHTKVHVDKNVSIIIPVEGKNDQFIITYGLQIALLTWDGESDKITSLEKLYEVEENPEHVFNDGKCDPSGRLWTGTMGKSAEGGTFPIGESNFYSFANGKVTKQLANISLSNGIAFNADLNKLYYNDSLKGTLDQFDFDIEKGTITNGKAVYTLFETYNQEDPDLKVLDGMTIDSDGNLWVAVFNQAKVIKIDPKNPETIAETVEIPAEQVTSVTFGGPNLDELFVTTGRLTIKGKGPAPSTSKDGAVYRVTGLNVKGFPGQRAVLSKIL